MSNNLSCQWAGVPHHIARLAVCTCVAVVRGEERGGGGGGGPSLFACDVCGVCARYAIYTYATASLLSSSHEEVNDATTIDGTALLQNESRQHALYSELAWRTCILYTSESSGGWFPAMDLMDDHHTRNPMDLHLEIP